MASGPVDVLLHCRMPLIASSLLVEVKNSLVYRGIQDDETLIAKTTLEKLREERYWILANTQLRAYAVLIMAMAKVIFFAGTVVPSGMWPITSLFYLLFIKFIFCFSKDYK